MGKGKSKDKGKPPPPPVAVGASDLQEMRDRVACYLDSLREVILLGELWTNGQDLPHFPRHIVWEELIHFLANAARGAWNDLGWTDDRDPLSNPDASIRQVHAVAWAQEILRDAHGRIPRPPADPVTLFLPGELDALRAALALAKSIDESRYVVASQSDVALAYGYKNSKRAGLMEDFRIKGRILYQPLLNPVGRKNFLVHMNDPGQHARLVLITKCPTKDTE